MPRIVLASQSQSRRRLLEDAGLKPTIIVSHVDEETEFFNAMTPEDMVIALAISKAHTVREMIDYPAIIIGCDSTFDVDGVSFGKPGSLRLLFNAQRKLAAAPVCFILVTASSIPTRELRFRTESQLRLLLRI